MKDREIARQNNLSDADLVADCRQRISQARLDLTDLAGEGVTGDDLAEFEQEVEAFEQLPGDEALEYERVRLREIRDQKLEAGRSALRDVRNPVRRAYGDSSPQLKRFGMARLADAEAPEVLNHLADAQQTGLPYLTDDLVKKEGFTQARLEALAPAHEALRTAQQDFLDADQARAEGTRRRVQHYNALDTRCAKLCARGYDHYVERNATKTKAYVRNPAPGPAGPQQPAA